MTTNQETHYVNKPENLDIDYPLSLLAENYVLYASSIGVQYVFEGKIDLELFKHGLRSFLSEFPALSGFADFKNRCIAPSPHGVPIKVVRDFPGHANKYGDVGEIQRNRTDFVFEPERRDVVNGKANLFTVQITYFSEGGSIVGITLNHAMGDATGHHLVAHRLADHIQSVQKTAKITGSQLNPLLPDIFGFGTQRNKASTFSALKTAKMSKPLKVKGPSGRLFYKLIALTLDKAKRSPRELFYFTQEDIALLKDNVAKESGLDWVSTNMALGAHLCATFSPILFGKKPAKKVQLSNLFNMRNRYFSPEDRRQNRYCGNAMYIHVHRADFDNGIQNANRGAIARALQEGFETVNTEKVKLEMDLVVDCLRHGYTYPNLDAMKPLIGINNQSKIPAYGVDFGAGELLRVIPQDVGDNILLFPGKDGGIEVYLRHSLKPKKTALLKEPFWTEKISSVI